MKLHASSPAAFYNTVTAYGPGYVEINEKRYESSVLLMPEGPIQPWDLAGFEQLNERHFEAVLALNPELVVFGTGAALRFAHPRFLRTLTDRQIGVESMDSQAACRTYNILMSEGRRVAAALLIEAPSSSS
ncbi:MAG: Mth938-like domain-containing protein [Burkholderiaceae bacterium]